MEPVLVDENAPAPKKRRWRKRLLIGGAAVLVVAGAYVGAAFFFGGKVPSGTTVAGVAIGGKSPAAAEQALTSGLSDRIAGPIDVSVGSAKAQLKPADAGLTFDAKATVDELTNVSLNPVHLWYQIFGGEQVDPVVHVNSDKLDAALKSIDTDVAVAPADGQVAFTDGQVTTTAPVDGVNIDVKAAEPVLSKEWLTTNGPITLPVKKTEPSINQAEVDRVAKDVAPVVLSGPVTVTVDGQSAQITPDQLAANASFVPQDGKLVLTMNGAGLDAIIRDQVSNIGTPPVNATIAIVNGTPTITPGKNGQGIDDGTLATKVATAAESSTDRTTTADLTQVEPSVTEASLQALGIKEKVSEYATPYPYDPQRTHNLQTAVNKLNGTIIMPGQQFSLSGTLGELSAANGYVASGVVDGGAATTALGGGVSQIATTTYNAAYFAGLQLDYHQAHTRYFSRYPAGRDATIFQPSIDLKFTNQTPYGILIQAYLADNQVHVEMWSTKTYNVTSTQSGHYNITTPTTVHQSGPSCVPQNAGENGFSIDDTRTVKDLNGNVVNVEKRTTKYQPVNKIVCD